MFRLWSTCIAVGLVWLEFADSAEAQPQVFPVMQEEIVEPQLPQPILAAGGLNHAHPTPQQIIDALRARGGGVLQINRQLVVGGNMLQSNAYVLTVVEARGGVLFQLHNKILPADEAQPHELQLDEQQAELIVRRFVDQCTQLCQELSQGCNLSLEQWEKLNAAAVIDATRFIRHLRGMFAGTLEEQLARELNPRKVQQEAHQQLSLGIHSATSLFRKVLFSQITSDQCRDFCRWQAASLFLEIDRDVEFLMNAENRPSAGHSARGQQPERYATLTLQQQSQLCELMINSGVSLELLIGIDKRQRLPNLLADIDTDRLSDFLSAAQVQAVLRHKSMQQSLEERRERFLAEINLRIERAQGEPKERKGWHLLPVR